MIFSDEIDDLSEEYKEFNYSHNLSVSVPLKNSVSKILRLKDKNKLKENDNKSDGENGDKKQDWNTEKKTDDKYGNKASVIKRLGLHAYELDITISDKEYKFVAKMPSVFNSVFSK